MRGRPLGNLGPGGFGDRGKLAGLDLVGLGEDEVVADGMSMISRSTGFTPWRLSISTIARFSAARPRR